VSDLVSDPVNDPDCMAGLIGVTDRLDVMRDRIRITVKKGNKNE